MYGVFNENLLEKENEVIYALFSESENVIKTNHDNALINENKTKNIFVKKK